MATLRQIEANRRNAQRSTGPRSAAGKAVSRLNALKSGIDANSHVIPGEDPAELDALAERYHHRWQPATPEEIFLLDAMIAADWLKRRMNKVEAQFWTLHMKNQQDEHKNVPLGKAFDYAESTQIRLQRRLDAADRSFNRSMAALKTLQAERRKSAGELPAETPVEQPEPVVQPLPQPAASQPAYPEIGFVPHSLPDTPPRTDARSAHLFPGPRPLRAPSGCGPASEASPLSFRGDQN